MTLALSVGLHHLVAMILKDDNAPHWYLSHAKDYADNAELRMFGAVGSISSHVTDQVLLELLQDDRLAMRGPAIRETMEKELQYVHSLDNYTWGRLADVANSTVPTVRDNTIRSVLISKGYMVHKFLDPADKEPWTLARGDVADNIRRLAEGPRPEHPVSIAIWELWYLGYNRVLLRKAVEKLAAINWSTAAVEQGHGSLATIHKFHPEYGPETLMIRAFLHMMRVLAQEDPECKKMLRLSDKTARLRLKQPEKINGRHIFMQDELIRARRRAGFLTQSLKTATMKLHGKKYKALSAITKRKYDAKAVNAAVAKRRRLQAEIQETSEQIETKRELVEDRLRAGTMNRMGACRWSEKDIKQLETDYNDPYWTTGTVNELRSGALQPPTALSPSLAKRLGQIDVPKDDELPSVVPVWAGWASRQRTLFQRTGFHFQGDGESTSYAFLYATQNPLRSVYVRLDQRRRTPMPVVKHPTQPWIERVMACRPAAEFDVRDEVVFDDRVQMPEDPDIFVIPDLTFNGYRAASKESMVPLEDFVEGLTAANCRRSDTRDSTHITQADVDKYAWLKDLQPKQSGPGSGRDTGTRGRGSGADSRSGPDKVVDLPEEPEELDDEDLDDFFRALEVERMELAHDDGAPENFVVAARGGKWTFEHKKQAFDSYRSEVKGASALDWCRLYGLRSTATYSIKKFTREVALALAKCWCDRMSYFYILYIASAKENYVYTDSDYKNYLENDKVYSFCKDLPAKQASLIEPRMGQIRSIMPSRPVG